MPITIIDQLEIQHPEILDVDSRDSIVARRNILLGLWAASRLGLSDNEVEAYAWSVHLADLEVPGHDDVIKKIACDFASRGKNIQERIIRNQLREMELRAFLQLSFEVTGGTRKARTSGTRMRSRAAVTGLGVWGDKNG